MKILLMIVGVIGWGSVWAQAWVPTKAAPVREVSIIVSKEGYYPKNFTVFQGERVKFFVTSTVDSPDCLIVQGHKIFMSATKGKITEGEAIFEHPGTFAFYCPATKHDGTVTVMKKVDPLAGRTIASDKNGHLWVPKEYD